MCDLNSDFYFTFSKVAEYCDEHMHVCVSLSTSISLELQSNLHCFSTCYIWSWLGFPTSSVVIHHVLPVLWMMSCLNIVTRNRRCEKSVGAK